MTLVWLTLAGFFAGLVDAIAGGGGIITVPALLAAGLPPHLALGTNKAQAVWGSGTALVSFARRGLVDRSRAPWSFVFALLGSLVGAYGAWVMQPEKLKAAVVVLLVVAAALSFIKKPVGQAPHRLALAQPVLVAVVIAMPICAYDGFFGPGTGTFLLLAYAYLFGDDLVRASGNAKVGNLASNLAAFALFAWGGAVRWDIAIPMGIAQFVGASVGVRLATRVGPGLVRVVATVVCVALAGRVAWGL